MQQIGEGVVAEVMAFAQGLSWMGLQVTASTFDTSIPARNKRRTAQIARHFMVWSKMILYS